MANYSIEIQRNNVTLAQFLRYVRQQCEKKGICMEIDREEFENLCPSQKNRHKNQKKAEWKCETQAAKAKRLAKQSGGSHPKAE